MNNLLRITVFLILFQVFSLVAAGQHKTTKVVYPTGQLIFNTTTNLNKVLTKLSSNDGVRMTEMAIKIDRPTHIYYGISKRAADGTIDNINNSLLLMPGDSIVIGNAREIKHATGFKKYTDSLISMELVYTFNRKKINDKITQVGLLGMLNYIEKEYTDNQKKIEVLKLPERLDKALRDFNFLIKTSNITNLDSRNINVQERKALDSAYAVILKNQERYNEINSPFVSTIYYQLISQRLATKSIPADMLWSNLPKVADLPFFKKFLITNLTNLDSYNPRLRDQRFNEIKAANLADAEITNLYKELLSRKPALENLILPDQDKILLTNNFNKTVSLSDILAKNKSKILIVDLWASWCAPCRAEFPKWASARNKFKNQSISFINVSIDLDTDVDKWKKAMVEEKESTNPNHYRLIDWKNSSLTKTISLSSIPRYLIIDRNGKILNSDFEKPSNLKFEDELKKYL